MPLSLPLSLPSSLLRALYPSVFLSLFLCSSFFYTTLFDIWELCTFRIIICLTVTLSIPTSYSYFVFFLFTSSLFDIWELCTFRIIIIIIIICLSVTLPPKLMLFPLPLSSCLSPTLPPYFVLFLRVLPFYVNFVWYLRIVHFQNNNMSICRSLHSNLVLLLRVLPFYIKFVWYLRIVHFQNNDNYVYLSLSPFQPHALTPCSSFLHQVSLIFENCTLSE